MPVVKTLDLLWTFAAISCDACRLNDDPLSDRLPLIWGLGMLHVFWDRARSDKTTLLFDRRLLLTLKPLVRPGLKADVVALRSLRRRGLV